jgi:hypothetical protein
MESASSVADLASGATDILSQLLLRPENIYIMAAVWSILGVIRKVLPPKISDHSWAVRLAPTYPLILCLAFVWIPGAQPADMAPASKLMVGCILAAACGYLHKAFNQTIRGKDSRIGGKKRRSTDK